MDPVKRLSDLKKLLDLDIITQDEYNTEKEKLMKMLGNEAGTEIPAQPRHIVVQAPESKNTAEKEPNIGWGVLGFFIPIVGLILFIVWSNTRPGDSKYAGVGALIGFILSIFIWVIIALA
ncbi:MAG: hypothetical protein ACI4W2_04290 [Eubacterium sp.]